MYRYNYLVIYFFLIFIKYTRVPGVPVAGTTFSLFTFPTTSSTATIAVLVHVLPLPLSCSILVRVYGTIVTWSLSSFMLSSQTPFTHSQKLIDTKKYKLLLRAF
jgi:hypothetical protein